MKYEKICLFWFLALPATIALRLIQLFFIIENSTGFFKQEFVGFGTAATLIVFAFAAVGAFFGMVSFRTPEAPPKKSIVVAALSVGFAAMLFYELTTVKTVAFMGAWQLPVLNCTSVLCIIFFLWYAASLVFDVKIPKICFVVPILYFIARIMCDFASIASLAFISDNLFYLAALCSTLVFFLQFAKLYAEIDTERNFRKILASGIVTSVFCLTQAVPSVIYGFIKEDGYSHLSKAANYSLLIVGAFVLAFVITHFKQDVSKEA